MSIRDYITKTKNSVFWQTTISVKNRLSRIGWRTPSKLSRWQLEILLLYLEAGYSIYQIIESGLWSDKSIDIENFQIETWLSTNGLSVVSYLMNFLPLAQALSCYLQISLFKEEFVKGLTKLLMYPSVQLALAFALSLVAQYWVLPLLYNLMSEMDVTFSSITIFMALIKSINVSIIVIAIAAPSVWLILKRLENSMLLVLLDKPALRLLKELIVYQFVSYYLILYQSCDSMEIIINGLRKLPQAKYLNSYGDVLHFSLLAGHDLATTFGKLDKKLELIFKIAKDTGKIVELLQSYVNALNLQFASKVKQIGRVVQAFSYCYISLLVVLIYQMMLMPLSMIEGM